MCTVHTYLYTCTYTYICICTIYEYIIMYIYIYIIIIYPVAKAVQSLHITIPPEAWHLHVVSGAGPEMTRRVATEDPARFELVIHGIPGGIRARKGQGTRKIRSKAEQKVWKGNADHFLVGNSCHSASCVAVQRSRLSLLPWCSMPLCSQKES